MASISVVVPTFNRADLLGETLGGVLAQTRLPDDVLVVDDGSDDGTEAVVAALGGIRYLRQEHAGPGAARNRGAAATRGELLAFLDSDDLWLPEHLEMLHGLLTAAADDVGAVLSWYRLFDADGVHAEVLFSQLFSAALVRRAAWDRVGSIDEVLPLGEDQDWFYRLREQGLRVLVADRERPTVRYRRHPGNLTNVERPTLDQYALLALRRSVERRREGAIRIAPFVFAHPEQQTTAGDGR